MELSNLRVLIVGPQKTVIDLREYHNPNLRVLEIHNTRSPMRNFLHFRGQCEQYLYTYLNQNMPIIWRENRRMFECRIGKFGTVHKAYTPGLEDKIFDIQK